MTGDSLNAQIGAQVRMYRKMAKISIVEMARTIGKSRATISKYETGAIGMDVSTLFEIASTLNIGVSHLLDIPKEDKTTEVTQSQLGNIDHFYLYQQSRHKNFCSYIRLGEERANGQIYATFYYQPEDIKNYKKCEGIYHGSMNIRDNFIIFIMQNLYCEAEIAYLSFFIPMKKLSAIPGILTGMDNYSMRPTAIKVILSKELMTSKELEEFFVVSKEEIKRLKEDHCFVIDP